MLVDLRDLTQRGNNNVLFIVRLSVSGNESEIALKSNFAIAGTVRCFLNRRRHRLLPTSYLMVLQSTIFRVKRDQNLSTDDNRSPICNTNRRCTGCLSGCLPACLPACLLACLSACEKVCCIARLIVENSDTCTSVSRLCAFDSKPILRL